MTRCIRQLLVAATTAAILCVAVGIASANTLSYSAQTMRTTWTSLTFRNTSNANTLLCPLTLEGSFHSATMAKTVGALVGYVSRASVASATCTGGHMTAKTESLPWHIRYRGFTGILPNIASVIVGIVGLKLRIEEPGLTCNATSEANNPVVGSISLNAGVAESFTPDPNARIPLEGEFGLCSFSRLFYEGPSQTLTQLGSTARIEVRLIGEPPQPVTLEPSPIAFGRLEPSQLSLRTVTITAAAEGSTVNRISMERANYFAITDPNRCTGARLAERARCSFKAVFVAPAEAGRTGLRDTITVEATGGNVRDTVEGST